MKTSVPDILFVLAAYFGAYLIPVLYLAGSLFRGRARKKLWWGMAIHTFWNLAVWGFVYYNWKQGYSEYFYAWVLLLPVNIVSAIYYLGAILWDHSRPTKKTFPA